MTDQVANRRSFLSAMAKGAGATALGWGAMGSARATQGAQQAGATWGSATDPTLFAQAWARRFTNTLPNPFDRNLLGVGFIYRPDPGTTNQYTISAGQIEWNVLGIPNVTTTVWGYGNYEGGTALPVTFPGRTFEVQRNAAIKVHWVNKLTDASGSPLPHLLPVDQTIAMQGVNTGVPIAVHHHGGNTAAEFDGGPDQWHSPLRQQVGPGATAQALTASGLNYEYTNAQEASLNWYHDHAEGLTRTNAYAGLAGLYVIRDANESAAIAQRQLPGAPYEVALVLQDKVFTADGSLAYGADPADYPVALDPAFPSGNPTHMPEMFGDVIVVNGVAWPNLNVEPRAYRFRLLNGSDARFYNLRFGTLPCWQVGTDLGLLNAPLAVNSVLIAPGERIDVVVDFSGAQGQEVIVTNDAATPFPSGVAPTAGSGVDTVMRLRVVLRLNRQVRAVDMNRVRELRGLVAESQPLDHRVRAPHGATVRRVLLGEGVDEYGRITPLLGTYDPSGAQNHGTLGFKEPPTETPTLGATEVWEFWNTTVDSHPIHMHLVKFRVMDRQKFSGTVNVTTMPGNWQGVQLAPGARLVGRATPAPATEGGWKDTVVCPPGMVTRVVVTFERRGKYVYHCHILSHEEHDMMRWYTVS